jgi:hypothetical protein
MQRIISTLFLASFIAVFPGVKAQEITTHPRLFLNADDLPTMKSWAVNTNPFYQQGIKVLAENIMTQVGNGTIPAGDIGGNAYSDHYCEGYAHVLAFMGHVEPNPAKAQQYKNAAITLLMYVMDRADSGVILSADYANYTPDQLRFRRLSFSTSDRSRWIGQAFPLAVDWLYNDLTTDQKRKIRRVFIRWAEENLAGYPNHNYFREGPALPIEPSNYNSPVWLDLQFDPVKKRAVRYSMNNYFNAHIRNVVLMSAAFDAVDDIADPLVTGDFTGRLRSYREKFLHTWFYMTDFAYRNENNGGMSAEGGEYMPSMGFTLQLLLGLETAKYDTAVWGSKISIASNPHWERTIPGLINSLPPKRVNLINRGGWNYQPSWYGDCEHLHLPDVSDIFAPIAVHARITGKTEMLESVKWILAYTPPGSIEDILDRIRSKEDMTNSLLLFMAFDPASANQVASGTYPSPHENTPTYHFAHGPGRISNRTSWGDDTRWLNYKLSWSTIDHQHGDGNMFDFYRKGEWITKERSGYGNIMGSSDYKNTLTIKRNTDALGLTGFHGLHLQRGAQLRIVNEGDPQYMALSHRSNYLSVTGDATKLYNYVPDYGTPVKNLSHVSRSLFWIKPDYIVVYDRVESDFAGFKRFWLNLPGANPEITEQKITALTPGGQQFIVNSLLPQQKQVSIVTSDNTLITGGGISTPEPYPAEYDPMGLVKEKVASPWDAQDTIELMHPVRLRIEATGNPLNTRFLNVLEGADAGAAAHHSSLIQSDSGFNQFEGASIDSFAVLFPHHLFTVAVPFQKLRFAAPAGVKQYFITGLKNNTSYNVDENDFHFTITEGSGYLTDEGGVLTFNSDLSAPVGIRKTEASKLQVHVYPNPAGSSVTIDLSGLKTPDDGNIEIYDVEGRLVLQEKTQTRAKITLNVEQLRTGYYFYKINTHEGMANGKLIIE